MAAKSSKHLINADDLLNESEEEVIETDINEDDYLMLHTPDSHRRGKSIRIGGNESPRVEVTPPSTPTPPERTSTPIPKPHLFPEGPHSTKLEIHIMTEQNPLPHKVMSVLHKCTTKFFQHRHLIHRLVNRAKMLLLNAEPYHTLLQQGYDFQLKKSQLSYKVLPTECETLVDFLLDPENMHFNQPAVENPIPFYEKHTDQYLSQTDISFEFRITPYTKPARVRKFEQGTMTHDAETLGPLIDHLRNSPLTWPTLPDSTQRDQTPLHTPPSRVSLSTCAPPKHHLDTQQQERDRRNRPRPHQRLGPPVTKQFGRSRSSEGRRGNGRGRYLNF